MSLINGTNLEFTAITSEVQRVYVFPGGDRVVISQPQYLNVSENGHRILDGADISHYVPKGWLHLSWTTKKGSPHFVK